MAKVKGKKILEIGCGDGYCLQELNKQGFETYGIEISKIRLDRCLKQGLNVIEGDIHNLPYPDNFFDNAIMSMIKGQWKGANPFTPPDVPVNFTEAIGLGILNAETIKNNLIELAKVRKGD